MSNKLSLKDKLYVQFINEESPKHPNYEAETRADYYEQIAINYDLFASWLIKYFDTRPNDAKWIRVEDELPENGIPVLVAVSYMHGEVCVAERLDVLEEGSGCFYRTDDEGSNLDGDVTHWMPLPEPPEEMEMNDENLYKGVLS